MVFISVFSFINPVLAENLPKPATLFQANCAGCHPNGNNIIRWGKTLKMKALKRNKIDTIEAISDLITNGKNNMPAYQDRLTTSEIDALADYVLEQAQNRWQS